MLYQSQICITRAAYLQLSASSVLSRTIPIPISFYQVKYKYKRQINITYIILPLNVRRAGK